MTSQASTTEVPFRRSFFFCHQPSPLRPPASLVCSVPSAYLPSEVGGQINPWEPPRLALPSEAPPSSTHTSLQTHALLLLPLQVSLPRRHILHGGVTARNKVRQENLTGIFLFVPELSVNAQTERTRLCWKRNTPPHTPNTPPPFIQGPALV